MSTTTDTNAPAEERLREVAVAQLKKRQDFRAHLLVYTLFCGLVAGIWALTGAGFPWPLIVMGFWGVGLIMNAYDVYGRPPIREEDIQREIERLGGT
jgi:fatty acid desaturase